MYLDIVSERVDLLTKIFTLSLHQSETVLTYTECISGGKRNEELILPINSSLSVTLHQEQVFNLVI